MLETLLPMVIGKVIDNFAPILISFVIGGLVRFINGFVKEKKENLAKDNILRSALDKVEITETQQEFVKAKALEALEYVEEKAFQSWKDDKSKELTGSEKKAMAVNFVEESTKGVIDEHVVPFIDKAIESVLVKGREEIDNTFKNLKLSFIEQNGKLPENARHPEGQAE